MSRAGSIAFSGTAALLCGTLAACSGGSPGEAGVSAGPGGSKVAKIVVMSPHTGSDAALGLGARNGAVLAIKQANERGTVPGWTLQAEAVDDKSDKATAASLAAKAASDGQVAGVVGSVFSGPTKAMLPELAEASVPVVAPTATNPTLTKGSAYATKPTRQFPFFFRVIAPDDAHGPAVARYLTEQGVNRVATVSDGDTYGTGVVAAFRAAYPGTVVDAGTVSTTDHGYGAAVSRIVATKAQAVFYGGTDAEAGPLSLQLKRAGLVVPLAGGDALATPAYIPLAGPVAAGDVSTAAGKPVDQVPAGQQFLRDYKSAAFEEPANGYSALAYDATNAMILALKESLNGAASAKDARAGTVKALASVSLDGTGGPVSFDAFGDVKQRVVTVQVLTKGAWKPARTYTF